MNDKVMTCPCCDAGPGEHCRAGCEAKYRQEAGLVKHDGADYLRQFWAINGAPTRAAAVDWGAYCASPECVGERHQRAQHFADGCSWQGCDCEAFLPAATASAST